ncbi:MAG: AMP-binding protein [Planctomycetia bacterium]|nr:AMP-binding protein [Planctomycetia bacterium]
MANEDIVSAVLNHAEHAAERICVETHSRRAKPAQRTFGQIAGTAARAAAFYHEHGLRAGDVVVLVGTHHIDFYAAWLGCVWLGAIPTVLAEPSVRVAKDVYWSRMSELLQRIGAWGLAADPMLKIENSLLVVPHTFRYDEIAAGSGPIPPRAACRPESTMLLQHSSGTTGLHKGVMLSHEAVWRHAISYNQRLHMTQSDVIATWLPLYHDMGFIACFVTPLLLGVQVVWLSPFEWVANPALLLDAISRHRATLAWLPNFAFAFMGHSAKAEAGQYDLSSVRALINCSEPVSREAMQAFSERFGKDGFSSAALHTCYAMAENVFAVTTSSADCPPQYRSLDRTIWHNEHRSVAVDPRAPGALTHVSNGPCVADCELRVVDDRRHELPAGHAGQILIRSPFLFTGYFRRHDLNLGLFDANGFFNTGDLGYVDEDGHVYVTGRAKDLIIIGGKNVYPQDVEQVVNQVPGVHAGRVVSFGVPMRDLGTEGLVVLVESDEPATAWDEIAQQIRNTVPGRLDIDVADARVVQRGQLRKSTSGKLARAGNREWYLNGTFGTVPHAISKDE